MVGVGPGTVGAVTLNFVNYMGQTFGQVVEVAECMREIRSLNRIWIHFLRGVMIYLISFGLMCLEKDLH